LEGSYLAACTFYASIFHKSPVGAAPAPTMWAMDAIAIQQQAAATVFDSLGVWKIDTLKPEANFVASLLGPNPNNTACEVVFDAFKAQPSDSVFWDFGDGTTGTGKTTTHLFYSIATHNVKWEVWKNCSVDSTFESVWANCFFGVEEAALQGIFIYPNPTTSKLRVEQFNQAAQNARFKIYSLQGALLAQGDDASEIDVSGLAAGIYLLEVEIHDAFSRQTFVKE
jgi:hypothetical protein